MAEGKERNIRGFPEASQRLPRGLLETSQSFIYCMATVKEMAMCNDITCAGA